MCLPCNMNFPPWHVHWDILMCDVHCTIWWVYFVRCPPWHVQCAMRHVHRGIRWSWYVQCDVQYVHYAIWYTFYFVHYAMCNVQWDMSTVEYVDLEAEHSVHFVQVQCTMCNETCPPWKDRSQQSMFLYRCINNRLRGENTVQMSSWEFGNNKGIKSSKPSWINCKKCTSPL